jgi:dienelactone hydrolase
MDVGAGAMTPTPQQRVAPYGAWDSPIAPEDLARGSTRLAFPRFGPDGALYVLEARPHQGGRHVVVRIGSEGARDVTPVTINARTLVHSYGGLSYAVIGPDDLVAVHYDDQRMYRIRGATAEPLTPETSGSWRYAEPVLDLARNRVIAVAERDDPGQRYATALLVAIGLDGEGVEVLAEGRDFYAAPAVSPDGTRLAFLAWDHPHMPWDAAELWVARLEAGKLARPARVVGGDGEPAFQPSWGPDGTLYVSLERGGFFNLHRVDDGTASPVHSAMAEVFVPLWMLGTRIYEVPEPSTAVVLSFAHGMARLGELALPSGVDRTLDDRIFYIGEIACSRDEVAYLEGRRGTRLWRLHRGTGETQMIHEPAPREVDGLDESLPEPITFATEDAEVAHGFFYPPKNRCVRGPEDALPPLLVLAHGGPTGCASATYSASVQFWTTRGYAVLDVNYRGSTGFGRAYRERLRGRWGQVDVADCAAGARFLAAANRIDPAKVVISGGSAGGYTVLMALANHGDVFRAGACHYGISDLVALVENGHKFESHYESFLIAPYPERKDLFVARSPIHWPERIRRPVVFFQGLEDKAVPPEQTERMATRLRESGVDVEYHAYAGEQHGFRKRDTLVDVVTKELAFFARVLALG